MSRLACLCFGTILSVAPGSGLAQAYDHLIDPKTTSRAEITFAFSQEPMRTLKASEDGQLDSDNPRVPREYGSAMTWYRVALADGYPQPPLVNSPLGYDEQLPEPLHWAWIAQDGNLITRVGKGIFRLSYVDSRVNWFRDIDCRLVAWPDGDLQAPMTCNDGTQRTMQIPGDGLVRVDGVPYSRVFETEVTALPPEVPIEVLMKKLEASGAVAASPETGSIESVSETGSGAGTSEAGAAGASAQQTGSGGAVETPANVPIPKPRPENPWN
jgi:hypothetical protein